MRKVLLIDCYSFRIDRFYVLIRAVKDFTGVVQL